MSKPPLALRALLERRKILDALRDLAGALPPAPSAQPALEVVLAHRELALGVCINELASPSTQLRHAVAAALRALGVDEAAGELEELAEDPRTPDENRTIAAELAREAKPRSQPSSYAFPLPRPDKPSSTAQLLAQLETDPDATDSFLSAWRSAPSATRLTVVEGLAESRDPRAVPLLEAAAADSDERIGHGALRALASFRFPEARDALEELASGSAGQAVRRAAARYLMGLEPDPPEVKGKAVHTVAGPVSMKGERDLLLAAPRSGGNRWDMLRVRLGVREGLISVETRPNITASAAASATSRLVADGGLLTPGPSYGRILIEDALSAPECGPNRLGRWSVLLGSRPLVARPYRASGEIGPGESKSNPRLAERLFRAPELRGWLIPDPVLDELREQARRPPFDQGQILGRFLDEFLEPRRLVLLRGLELSRDLLLRKGDRVLAKAVAAAEWTLREGERERIARDPFFVALLRRRLQPGSFEPVAGPRR